MWSFLCFQDLRGGVFGIDLFDDAFQRAGFVEDERAPEGAQNRFSIHFFLAPGAKGLKHLSGGIRQEAERQAVLGPEARVGLYAVLAHAHYVVALRREGRIIVPEAASLRRAPRRIVLGVKVDDGLLPGFDEVLRGNRVPILVQHLKGGHFISDL